MCGCPLVSRLNARTAPDLLQLSLSVACFCPGVVIDARAAHSFRHWYWRMYVHVMVLCPAGSSGGRSSFLYGPVQWWQSVKGVLV